MYKAANPWRDDFPILKQTVHKRPLVYLDNAATSQMPQQVIDRYRQHYEMSHSNIHRGIHYLSTISTNDVENTRELAGLLLHDFDAESRKASEDNEIVIFTAGATDSINLVASSFRETLQPGQGILTTDLEHHSNYVPWQQACRRSGADFYVCPSHDGEIDLDQMEKILKTHRIALAAVAHVTNLTGTVYPIKEITDLAHRYGARVLIDGAQGILHEGVNVRELDCDYYCFSGHKMLAPTGVGVLYGKKERLEELLPVRFGGGMVDQVTESETTWGPLPGRLEAGTPNISGIIGLGEAVRYLQTHDPKAMREHEKKLISYTRERLQEVTSLTLLGHPETQAGAVSFTIAGVQPFDLAGLLDRYGIALRSGTLCAQPALAALGADRAIRISPSFYNTFAEIDLCVDAVKRSAQFLQKIRKK